MRITTQRELLTTSNPVKRSITDERVMLDDVRESGLTIEDEFSIAGFPTIGSCLRDLPQPPIGFNNRFQVIAANIDSWRTKLAVKLKSYRSIIADLVTASKSISYACDANARAITFTTDRMDSLTEPVDQLKVRVSSNRDNLLLIRSIIDQLCAISDSQVSLLTNQSQVLRETHLLAQSLHVPTTSVETADPEHPVIVGGPGGIITELEQTVIENGSAGVGASDISVDFSGSAQSSMSTPKVSNATSGNKSDDHPNNTRERDVVRVRTNQSKNLSLTAIWINQGSNYNFPCPLQSHDHELAKCPEFLALSPKNRWFKIPRGRICYTCLKPKGPNGVCKVRQCTEKKSVPQALVCIACTQWAAFNILLCRKLEHGMDCPPIAEVSLALEGYLGKISVSDDKLRFTANFNYHAFSVSETIIPPNICTPSFDSELGIEVDTSTVVFVPEVPEQSVYLMQWLKIGGNNLLTLFDRGANVHLVQRKMAVASGFELISLSSTLLTVVGGDKLKLEYGNYRFNLGPGAGGEYHELSCLGMDSDV